ncbi:myo-inositol transporter [Aspergillus saccharolyticus JOP 1030-1]|uniref:Uncharacterized protein n=1 Tax=Aspergillus saccharolyticus JOP 1030-1 TaxID=1450539 RepID=A0A318Z171_9EURO|nr:hypothetical protein BP01DRAFT_411522 [Aspergillus saccharolyticus JOP 1030-1]PYH40124.1 hypothetical protein BP01DRAFT_411522 [Aspergillus saccharolyticus JOP 1030-1]
MLAQNEEASSGDWNPMAILPQSSESILSGVEQVFSGMGSSQSSAMPRCIILPLESVQEIDTEGFGVKKAKEIQRQLKLLRHEEQLDGQAKYAFYLRSYTSLPPPINLRALQQQSQQRPYRRAQIFDNKGRETSSTYPAMSTQFALCKPVLRWEMHPF